MYRFQTIPTTGLTREEAVWQVMRLNCLGSLFYFVRTGLRRRRLTAGLHAPLCASFEREHIKDVIEMPRDHFKSTCSSEGLAMWRALPLSQQDIDCFMKLGYTQEFIDWMQYAHNPDSRNLLVSGNITNAAKLGKKIRYHFENNALYRTLFPETLPDTSCTWTDYSLHVKRPNKQGGAHGEGTFDFMGVGGAIQSRHYNGIVIQDDLIGLKESESQALMDKAIDYHKLLVGVFESEDATHALDELVIGNRWGYEDLNSHLREHEPEFRFESHSALGGCCDRHPYGQPIFPEEFSVAKLEQWRRRLGSYKFSCQFLNDPSSPQDSEFKEEWLQYFEVHDADGRWDGKRRLGKWRIRREVSDGIIRSSIDPFITRHSLAIAMVVDPNHSGNAAAGRARHAIVVDAVNSEGEHFLLESWAERCGYDDFYDKIFEIAMRWGLHKVGVETIGAQKYIKNHLELLSAIKMYAIRVEDLKGQVDLEDGTIARAKRFRICGVIQPIAESRKLNVQRYQQSFINEYKTFTMKRSSRYVDQLDAFAYAPQIAHRPMADENYANFLAENQAQMERVGRPYVSGYGEASNTGVFSA
jgi:hypothetical protein